MSLARMCSRSTLLLGILLIAGCGVRRQAPGPLPLPESHPEENRQALVERARREATAVVQSEAFRADLARVKRRVADGAPYAAAWAAVDSDGVVNTLRARIGTEPIQVVGGWWQRWLWYAFGTLATEGTTDGPIRVNWYGLPRPVGSVANTIVHELAHRIDLGHPSYEESSAVGICEPPYVIGALVERQIEGGAWQRSVGDCPALIDPPASVSGVVPVPSQQVALGVARHGVSEYLPRADTAAREEAVVPYITLDRLRAACANASAAAAVTAYCQLDLAAAGSQRFRVPTPMEIEDAASGGAGRPALAVGEASALGFGTAFSLNQGAILVGLTDFAVGRAKETGRVYLTQQFTAGLCRRPAPASVADARKRELHHEGNETVAAYIPATCALLSSRADLLGSRHALPSFAVLQSLMERDIQGLPNVVVERLREHGTDVLVAMRGSPGLLESAERLSVAIGMARLGATVLASRDVPLAFRVAGIDILHVMQQACVAGTPQLLASCAVPWERVPFARGAAVAASLIGTFADADLDSLAIAAHSDRMLALATKALLVNARGGADGWRTPLGGALTDFLERNSFGVTYASGEVELNASRFASRARAVTSAVTATRDTLRAALAAARTDSATPIVAYGAAVPGLVTAAGALVKADAPTLQRIERLNTLASHVSQYPGHVAGRRYALLVTDLMGLVPSIADDSMRVLLQRAAFHPAALRTMQFALDATRSQTPDAFQAVLESYAAPANAYLRKRSVVEGESRRYWALNSYVGGAGGLERAVGGQVPGDPDAVRFGGLTLPVGLEIGVKVDKGPIGAVGALVQLVDLGQVATWRARGTDSVSTTPPALTFGSVFAPGIFGVVNFARLPVALGAGLVHAPKFRDLTYVTDPARPRADVRRYALFLAVDVPLLP